MRYAFYKIKASGEWQKKKLHVANGPHKEPLKTMKRIKTIYLVTLGSLVFLLAGLGLHAEQVRIAENLRREIVILPASAPNRDQLVLNSFETQATKAKVMVSLAAYDDPQTERTVDYVELYDEEGNLLLITWIDRFCIERTAMDIGLLEEDAFGLQRILILVVDGTPA
jgi:hypothetical protein